MEDKIINTEVLDNKCPNCNASISYNPKTSSWKCEYCNSSFTLEELRKFNNASSEKNNDDIGVEEDTYDNYISYQCKNCGAEIVADEQTAATFCVYCGNTAILKEKLSNEFKPNLIIPFKNTKKYAEQSTLEGNCVITPVYSTEENFTRTDEQIENLKNVHFKKIDLSDAICVINVNEYIGESTKLEIEYARSNNKKIMYLEKNRLTY